jgi:hypothetical protein
MLITFQAPATHLYPGLEGAVVADGPLPQDRDETADCAVEFSDGVVAFGVLEAEEGERYRLIVRAHTTARGTDIPEKSWGVTLAGAAGDTKRFRVTRRGA